MNLSIATWAQILFTSILTGLLIAVLVHMFREWYYSKTKISEVECFKGPDTYMEIQFVATNVFGKRQFFKAFATNSQIFWKTEIYLYAVSSKGRWLFFSEEGLRNNAVLRQAACFKWQEAQPKVWNKEKSRFYVKTTPKLVLNSK